MRVYLVKQVLAGESSTTRPSERSLWACKLCIDAQGPSALDPSGPLWSHRASWSFKDKKGNWRSPLNACNYKSDVDRVSRPNACCHWKNCPHRPRELAPPPPPRLDAHLGPSQSYSLAAANFGASSYGYHAAPSTQPAHPATFVALQPAEYYVHCRLPVVSSIPTGAQGEGSVRLTPLQEPKFDSRAEVGRGVLADKDKLLQAMAVYMHMPLGDSNASNVPAYGANGLPLDGSDLDCRALEERFGQPPPPQLEHQNGKRARQGSVIPAANARRLLSAYLRARCTVGKQCVPHMVEVCGQAAVRLCGMGHPELAALLWGDLWLLCEAASGESTLYSSAELSKIQHMAATVQRALSPAPKLEVNTSCVEVEDRAGSAAPVGIELLAQMCARSTRDGGLVELLEDANLSQHLRRLEQSGVTVDELCAMDAESLEQTLGTELTDTQYGRLQRFAKRRCIDQKRL